MEPETTTLQSGETREEIECELVDPVQFERHFLFEAPHPKSRRDSIDVECVYFDQSLFDLQAKLENRPTKQDLVSHNIIKEERQVAPCIQATQQKLKFNRAVDELDSKVRNRPTRVELLDCNIMKEGSPGIQAAQQSLKWEQMRSTTGHLLENRPAPSFLVEHNIMKEGTGGRVAANLQSTQQSLKFQTTVATVDHKLEKRPSQQDLMDHNIIRGLFVLFESHSEDAPDDHPDSSDDDGPFTRSQAQLETKMEHRAHMGELVDHNILKTNSRVVAPSLHAKRESLGRQMSNSKLNTRLELRPSKGTIKQQNILVLTLTKKTNRRPKKRVGSLPL